MDGFSEKQRLVELQRYDILNWDMREDLNGLTRVASGICDTPISLVNVLDDTRQITKCSNGWDPGTIPREDGFCHYAIQGSDLMIVEDAREDDRFRRSRFVQRDPNIRFYAGVPLSNGNGVNLGALCVIDQETKSLTNAQKEGLELLAEEIMARFEFKRKELEVQRNLEQLQQSLEQKELLLSEIHHRLKNDLSIISGLIQLEIFSTKDSQSREVLQKSQMRIQSMASVHQMLHNSEDIGKLPFHEFIKKVVDSIRSIYAGDNKAIRIELEANCCDLRFKQAMPSALIINELITNAYKHAFPGDETGTISISITSKDNHVSLCVQDDGVGLPDDFSPDDTDSIGMMLIYTLADQLKGKVNIDSTDGTAVIVRFKQEVK